jgi:hypothetical protein
MAAGAVGATPPIRSPDHPLYLLLADIAAEHSVPIDIHMESGSAGDAQPAPPGAAARLRTFVFISALSGCSRTTRALRSSSPHLGSDNTDSGRRKSAAGCWPRTNLYLEIKHDPLSIGRNPVLADGSVTRAWLDVIREFPDRFVIGSDQHYPLDGQPVRWPSVVTILNQLPPDLRNKVGVENPRRVFAGSRSASGR